jgi:hypothetical protein
MPATSMFWFQTILGVKIGLNERTAYGYTASWAYSTGKDYSRADSASN